MSVAVAISAEHLVRRFGNFTAVNDVSFRVQKGEIFGFLGPNGSGKTTVIKMLTGLLPLSGGQAHVEGLDVRTDSESVRERIGYMSQNFSLYYDLTVAENWQFYGRIYSLEAERCSHVAYIYYGKLIADGTPNSLRELPDVQPHGTKRVEITTPEVTRALRFARQIPGIRSATIFGQSIHALIDDHCNLDDLREQLLKHDIAVGEIRPLAPSLEDVFVELTYKHQALLEAARA